MRVVYTDNGFGDTEVERRIIEQAGGQLVARQCRTEDEVIEAGSNADALLVQWAPVTSRVIQRLDRCRLIVRIGIGFDNVDVAAARGRSINVCNVPDYCTDEVADHTMALALSSLRRLPQTDARTRRGDWSITPDRPIGAFSEQTFATVGFGRIARAVLERARPFRFRLAAVDPFLPENDFEEAGVQRWTMEQALAEADVLSLNCGLSEKTRHLIGDDTLRLMKPTAVIVNTSRGGLIDASALARALTDGTIGGAGLDVYEEEPLPHDSPLRSCPNAILTSHTAWYSTSSVLRLRELAAKEIVRFIRGEPPLHVVN